MPEMFIMLFHKILGFRITSPSQFRNVKVSLYCSLDTEYLMKNVLIEKTIRILSKLNKNGGTIEPLFQLIKKLVPN